MRAHAARVADALQKEPSVAVELVDGRYGEFTVLVDDRVVAKKSWFFKPSVEKILNAVRAVTPTETRA